MSELTDSDPALTGSKFHQWVMGGSPEQKIPIWTITVGGKTFWTDSEQGASILKSLEGDRVSMVFNKMLSALRGLVETDDRSDDERYKQAYEAIKEAEELKL